MLSIRVFLVATLLVLSGADAKKHKVYVSKWANNHCDGHPLGGKQLELKKDECQFFSGNSVRVQQHRKKKYNKWINNGNDCYINVFDKPGCHSGGNVTHIPVPKDFENCTALSSEASSLMFWCDETHGWDIRAYNTTTVLPMTSYSIDKQGRAHPSEYTSTITTSATSLGAYHLMARAEPTHNAALEERSKQYQIKSLWAKHPWTGSDICYKCWTKKPLNYGKIECRSGPRHYIDCGVKPPHVSASSVRTITSTQTAEFYFTEISQFPTPTYQELEARRSRHIPVILENPYSPGYLMCADAEWEKEGNVNKQEIRLQKFKELHKCHDKNAVYLNFDKPMTTVEVISYMTATAAVARPTWVPVP
jgi:hypothetical protein